jgi:hypothetical protein
MAAIRITNGDTQSGELTMIDSNGNPASTIRANRGETITWQIEPRSGVSAIAAIDKKDQTGNENIFSVMPAPLGNSKNWQGTISNVTPADQEFYFIKWLDTQNPANSHTYDPLIQLNPGLNN